MNFHSKLLSALCSFSLSSSHFQCCTGTIKDFWWFSFRMEAFPVSFFGNTRCSFRHYKYSEYLNITTRLIHHFLSNSLKTYWQTNRKKLDSTSAARTNEKFIWIAVMLHLLVSGVYTVIPWPRITVI